MANEKFLNTRIINKHDSLTNWNSSTLPLKEGEIALAYVETTKPDNHGGSYTIPTYLMKVGVEGKTFSEVEWLAAPASDVYAWAKLENPTIEQLPANLKTAIENLQSAVGDGGSVAESIANAINLLDSESTGEGTIVKSVVQTDGKVSVTMGTLSADEIPTLTASKISDFESTVATKVESYGYETVANINAYKEEITELLKDKQEAGDYAAEVHTHVKADITDFDHTHTASEITDFATEVAKVKVDNAARADEATKAIQDGNGKVISDTYAEKATTLAGYGIGDAYTKDEVDGEIEGAIADFVKAYIDDEDETTINTLTEIASWIADDEAGAAKVIADVSVNTEGIKNLTDRMDAAEDAIEAIHTHENKDVLDGITAEKVSAWDGAEAAAKGYADGLNTEMNTRVEALEDIDHSHTFVESELNKIADGDVAKWNVTSQTASDNAEAIEAINDIETGILAQAKTNAANQDVVVLSEAQKYADGLASNYATAEQGEKADTALQEVIANDAKDTEGNITKHSGLKVVDNNKIEIDDTITWIFDCGSSEVTE